MTKSQAEKHYCDVVMGLAIVAKATKEIPEAMKTKEARKIAVALEKCGEKASCRVAAYIFGIGSVAYCAYQKFNEAGSTGADTSDK